MAAVVVHNFSFEAVASLKDHTHPDRGPLLSYLRTAAAASRKDAQGVWRLLSSLRLTDAQVQLPVADKVIAWDSRLFVFVSSLFCQIIKLKKKKENNTIMFSSRLGVAKQYPEMFNIVRPIYQKILTLRWASVAKVQDAADFAKAHRADLLTLFPENDIDPVIALHCIALLSLHFIALHCIAFFLNLLAWKGG